MGERIMSRWSRRKKASGSRLKAPDASTDDAVAELGRAAAISKRNADLETSDAEPAELPCLDDLTAHSDVTCFLRAGVPAALRNAALRKMWLLDPAIRDFVGPARDYDFDWNAAGGVPGGGALGVADDVTAMLRTIMGDRETTEFNSGALPDQQPLLVSEAIAPTGVRPRGCEPV